MAEPTIAQQKKLIKILKHPERFYKIDLEDMVEVALEKLPSMIIG